MVSSKEEEGTISKVSVILPAFNEAEHIYKTVGNVCNSLTSTGWDYEVIVVDDGSWDSTGKEATRANHNGKVRVLGYPKNRGKGHALRYGAMHARGNVLVFLDGDLDIDPECIRYFVSAMGNADLAIGSKRHSQSKVEVPIIRRILSYGFNVFARLLTGVKSSDTQSGLKVGRADAIKRILPLLSVKRYAFDVELIIVAQLLQFRVVELPLRIKLGGLFSVRAIARIMIDMLGIAYRLRIKHWYQSNLDNPNAEYRPIIKW